MLTVFQNVSSFLTDNNNNNNNNNINPEFASGVFAVPVIIPFAISRSYRSPLST